MNRVAPPDVLLVKLLRRSDSPSEEEIHRLLTAVELRVTKSTTSPITLPKQSAIWVTQERFLSVIDDSRTVLKTYFLLGFAFISRFLVKIRLISSRLLLQ
jgi:hypothetical protein